MSRSGIEGPLGREEISQIREDLAAAFRLAVRFDLHEGICNHFTARTGPDSFLLNPEGLHWSEITAGCLDLMHGSGPDSGAVGDEDLVAYHIHWPVYRARPEVMCVLHTHMPYATGLTMIRGGRLALGEQKALRFNGRIAYDDEYPGPVATQGEGEGKRLARVLGNKEVLFAKNHGVVVVGRSIGQAFDDLYYLERCCRKQWIAQGYGSPLDPITSDVADATRQLIGRSYDKYKDQHFAALRRMLDRDEPNYRDQPT